MNKLITTWFFLFAAIYGLIVADVLFGIDMKTPGRSDTKGLSIAITLGWIPAATASLLLICFFFVASNVARVLFDRTKRCFFSATDHEIESRNFSFVGRLKDQVEEKKD